MVTFHTSHWMPIRWARQSLREVNTMWLLFFWIVGEGHKSPSWQWQVFDISTQLVWACVQVKNRQVGGSSCWTLKTADPELFKSQSNHSYFRHCTFLCRWINHIMDNYGCESRTKLNLQTKKLNVHNCLSFFSSPQGSCVDDMQCHAKHESTLIFTWVQKLLLCRNVILFCCKKRALKEGSNL